jgi:hypothetical protein
MSTTTDRAVLDSPLFKLPPELRDPIYEYAVSSEPRTSCKSVLEGDDEPPVIELFASYSVQEPPLLHVCQTIRREALGYLLARPSFKVSLYVSPMGEVSLGFREHEAFSTFSKSNSERDKVTSTPRRRHDAAWVDATGWLHEAEEVLDRGGDVGQVARRFMTGGCYRIIIHGGILPVERKTSIDLAPVSVSPFHFQCGAVARTC